MLSFLIAVPDSSHFPPIDATLPDEEQAARAKRQHCAEWGLAVARLGGTETAPDLLAGLQRYIDGEVSLAELSQAGHPPGQPNQVFQDVARRERFAG